jgi:hypothetical protein
VANAEIPPRFADRPLHHQPVSARPACVGIERFDQRLRLVAQRSAAISNSLLVRLLMDATD